MRDEISAPLLRVGDIVAASARAFGMSQLAVVGEGRHREAVRARRVVCVLAREAGWSLPHIGRVLRRDHTTVLHHLRWAARERAVDADVAAVRAALAGLESEPVIAAPPVMVTVPAPKAAKPAQQKTPPQAAYRLGAGEYTAPPYTLAWWAENDKRFRAKLEEIDGQ